jgi:ribosomal protein S13
VKSQLKSGQVSVSDLLVVAQVDDIVAGMRVISVLEALPGIGRVKAAAIMESCGIAVSRRLRGLGPHQTNALCRLLDQRKN